MISAWMIAATPAAAVQPPALQPSPTYKDCADCPEMQKVPNPHAPPGALSTIAVSVTPITFAEWQRCLNAGGCGGYAPERQNWPLNTPVVNVSYEDAQQYIAWLRRISGKAYRLPRETEWAALSLGGQTSRYPWGDRLGSGHGNCLGCGSPWDGKRASPVRSFKPNAYGLYDMTGNIAHWTEPAAALPTASDGLCGTKHDYAAIFGGSWADLAQYLGPSSWACFPRILRDDTIGFRVVRDD